MARYSNIAIVQYEHWMENTETYKNEHFSSYSIRESYVSSSKGH